MSNRVFVQGRRVIISLAPGISIKDKDGGESVTGLSGMVLHGSETCRSYARAILAAAEDWVQHALDATDRLVKHYPKFGIMVVDDTLVLTIISASLDKISTALVLKDPNSWIDLADNLLDAAAKIDETDIVAQPMPVISPWRSGKKLRRGAMQVGVCS